MNTILWNYESVWPKVWPKNKCRSHWPILHGPVILPYILKTGCSMNIILQDYESVWHNIWPLNKCRSLWPVFHSPVILPYILKTIYTPGIYADGYMVFVFPFVRLYVRLFIRSYFCSLRGITSVLRSSNLSGVYFTNHSSESIHFWTIGTLEGRLSFHDSSAHGPCPGMGLEVKI